MQDELISIDKLEDQIIDHPDASTKKELHDSLDETFQKKLNARAEQIRTNQTFDKKRRDGGPIQSGSYQETSGSVNFQFLVTKSHLKYEYKDYGSIQQELSEWFTYNDLSTFGGVDALHQLFESNRNQKETDNNVLDETELIKKCVSTLKKYNIQEGNPSLTTALKILLYFSFGQYGDKVDSEEQLHSIVENNKYLVSIEAYLPLTELINKLIQHQIDVDSKRANTGLTAPVESDYFIALTLLYFMICTMLSLPVETPAVLSFKSTLGRQDLLTSITKFIENWKWKPANSYRIRYLIMMSWKLILFEMGDTSQLKKCDDFLVEYHDIKNKKGKDLPSTKLTCSPLDYFAFREDLLDKYPLYNDPNSKVFDFSEFHKHFDNDDEDSASISSKLSGQSSLDERYKYFMAINSFSNSLSNLVESPKTNRSHTVFSQLPAQTVHIATPVPSPKLMTSDYMSGGEKIRRSYQVNQAMPFIYPNASDMTPCTSSDGVEVPYAIKEANEILKDSVYESYSIKRLWDERQRFMKQERGYVNEYGDEAPDELQEENYDNIDYGFKSRSRSEIRSIRRVEDFYSKNIVRLHTFIQVLVETIKSNRMDYNLNFAEWELNPETSYFNKSNTTTSENGKNAKTRIEYVLMSQLEVINIKEITLKASTSIIILLLKWFKISHVLKYYYLSSILFDQQFFTITLDYLGNGFNNSNLQSMATADKMEDLTDYEILVNQNKLMNPQIKIPKFEFFNNCIKSFPTEYHYELINRDMTMNLPETVDENSVNHIYITKCNENFAFILSNILKIINKILIKNVTHRIFTFNELKPSELYKMILINYDNESLSKPILKTLKKLIPYQGRKWKSINMDLISQIYLNLKLSVKDNWLSGKDLESDFNNSYDQEIALRGLLQFYNIRKYPKQMNLIGYQINKDLDIPVFNLNEDEEIF
ncbi:Factor arrest protein 11 [Scheffersomyces stipitis CBS 6054]|uniref:Factor arrest protein 11 n=1 Tax=Scheffersomyces stipitis (strain ATCC 58785 / CBS 6054 / NBRC 10063 / NRRL Y-11545) TaxID=322104 RepID=A3LPE3_PICST|nr:Factor arrest protein 11 [Scheffersomyces stipitis CBS 6054]ABN65029.2 Factor arrest protein 11 [Scheffersomyces stipitis CBS 6054]